MKVVPFITDSAAEAVEQIRRRLGPEAVVLNVRPLPRGGLSRLWQRPRMEVLACVPELQSPEPAFAELRQEIAELKRAVEACPPLSLGQHRAAPQAGGDLVLPQPGASSNPSPGSAGTVLENLGILPLYAQRVMEKLQVRRGEQPPASPAEERDLLLNVMRGFWEKPCATDRATHDEPPASHGLQGRAGEGWQEPFKVSRHVRKPVAASPERHVFIGPAGTGKTTCLCKWLAQSVLLAGRSARVWRLNGRTANTAESLSVYGEILGAPVERAWSGGEPPAHEVAFIDLPGVEWQDAATLQDLGDRLAAFTPVQVHLVLNAAYEVPVLLAQARAFGVLPVTDLIVTHLDEDRRLGRLWNLLLGTNYTLRFLGAGQNIPGTFQGATPEMFLDTLLPRK